MTPDYDLSNLPTSLADVWIYLQVDAILGQILADQAERLGFPLALGADVLQTLGTAGSERYVLGSVVLSTISDRRYRGEISKFATHPFQLPGGKHNHAKESN